VSDDEKELKKCRKCFFGSFSYDRLRIYIHTLQYQCNPNRLNCNEQAFVMNIAGIKSQQIRAQYQS